jgi:hypothetical protein
MPTTLTEEIEKAYAANPGGEAIIETLEFDHSTFDEPARIATNIIEDIMLPLVSGGSAVLHKAIGIEVILPGMGEDGPTPMKIRIDNGSLYLLPYFRLAAQTSDPISVTYRAYTTTDLTKPGEVITGLEVRDSDLSATVAEASIGFREIELQAFPLATYDEQYYPALQDS